jgi:hypothetical protein
MNKLGNIAVYLIIGIIAGGLVGCIVGPLVANIDLSTATGYGCSVGLLVGAGFGASRKFA